MNGFIDFGLALRERMLQVLAILAIGVLATAAYVSSIPEKYTAFVQISVDADAATSGSNNPTSQSSALRHQQIVQHKVLSQDFLAQVIAELREQKQLPLLDDGTPLDVEHLRERLTIEPIGGSRESWQPQSVPVAFVVSATLGNPDTAVLVANRIAMAFLSFDRKIRLDKAQTRQKFYQIEAEKMSKQLADIETQIGNFKIEHAMELPSAVDGLRNRISDLYADTTVLEREQASLQKELQPEIGIRRSFLVTKKLSTIKAEHDLLVSRRNELFAQLRNIPENEKRLKALTRESNRLATLADAAHERVAKADLDVELAQTEWLASLSIDSLSERPQINSIEGRDKAFVLGLLLSMGLAALYVFLLEIQNPTVRTSAQLEKVLGTSPLVSIGHVSNATEDFMARLTQASMILLIALMAYVTFQLL